MPTSDLTHASWSWWLEGLIASNQGQRACEVVVGVFDSVFRLGQFAVADARLASLELDYLSAEVIVAALTVTWHARAQLPSRRDFVARARERLVVLVGDERTAALLQHRGA